MVAQTWEEDWDREECGLGWGPMVKAELIDHGPHDGMGNPHPDGSYIAFTLIEPNTEEGAKSQKLTFLVPAHQMPKAQ
ncbi:MAG: hypothetical protein AAFR84_03055 [Pseudomonadota bacterium]